MKVTFRLVKKLFPISCINSCRFIPSYFSIPNWQCYACSTMDFTDKISIFFNTSNTNISKNQFIFSLLCISYSHFICRRLILSVIECFNKLHLRIHLTVTTNSITTLSNRINMSNKHFFIFLFYSSLPAILRLFVN